MRILSRYVVRQHIAPFGFAVTALTGIMLLSQIAKRLPMLIGKGLPWTVIVEFFVLTLPYLIAMTIPMSVLVAVLYTFNRLATDSEITGFRAGGVSLRQLVRPVLVAATGVAVFAFLFGDQVLPRTNHELRKLMTDIGRTKPTFSLKEHIVNEVQRGRVFLRAARIDQSTYRMRDVTIYEMSDRNSTKILYADSGRIGFAPNQEDLHLSLYDGSVHDFDRSDPGLFRWTPFHNYLIKLEDVGSEFMRNEGDTYHSDRELGICELEEVVRTSQRDQWIAERRAQAAERNGLRELVGLTPVQPDTAVPRPRRSWYCGLWALVTPAPLQAQEVQSIPPPQQTVSPRFREITQPTGRAFVSGQGARSRMNEARIQRDRARGSENRAAAYQIEVQKKYAIPAACIVFVLVCVPVGLRFPGSGLGLVIGAGMSIFSVYYVGLIGGESLAERLSLSPFLAMWTPNIVFGMFGLVALWRLSRQGVNTRGGESRWRRLSFRGAHA